MLNSKYNIWMKEFPNIKEKIYRDKRINLPVLKPGVTFSNEEYKKNYELYLEEVIKPRLREYEEAKQAGFEPIIFDY